MDKQNESSQLSSEQRIDRLEELVLGLSAMLSVVESMMPCADDAILLVDELAPILYPENQ